MGDAADLDPFPNLNSADPTNAENWGNPFSGNKNEGSIWRGSLMVGNGPQTAQYNKSRRSGMTRNESFTNVASGGLLLNNIQGRVEERAADKSRNEALAALNASNAEQAADSDRNQSQSDQRERFRRLRMQRLAASGRAGTIVTGGLGLPGDAQVPAKTLLGA
jgi:hypothetical protein